MSRQDEMLMYVRKIRGKKVRIDYDESRKSAGKEKPRKLWIMQQQPPSKTKRSSSAVVPVIYPLIARGSSTSHLEECWE